MPRKAVATNVLSAIFASHWCITEEALANIIDIASRENLSPEALETKLGRPLDNAREVTVRDGVATIPITGPMFRYAHFFTRVSGATSYDDIATDFTAALEDPEVRAILLAIDSPGGEVNGLQELAQLVHDARGVKPVIAYVGGTGASAAYWLGSAADQVFVGETAIVGSIGVLFTVRDTRARDEKAGVRTIHIASSQSPKKHLDPTEDAGRSEMQTIADALAEVFVSTVARNRDVTAETVLADFGQGSVMVGADAVTAGLADGVSTYEAVLAEMAASAAANDAASLSSILETYMSEQSKRPGTPGAAAAIDPAPSTGSDATRETVALETPEQFAARNPAVVAAWRAEGAAQERARLLAIEELATPGAESVIGACKADATCTPGDAALKVVAHLKSAGVTTTPSAAAVAATRHLEALAKDERELEAPTAGAGGPKGEEAVVLRITSTYDASRPARARVAAGRN